MFGFDAYWRHVGALLVSPYRGLLVYAPLTVLAVIGTVIIAPGPRRPIAWGGVTAVVVTVLFVAAFRYWSGGHGWGPRFLVGPHILLAPGLAAFFSRYRRMAHCQTGWFV